MSHETSHDHETDGMFSNAQRATAIIIGAVLTLVGIWGFVTGDEVLIFGVNTLHNIAHLLTGLLAIAVGVVAAGAYSDETNKALGVVYALLFLLWVIAPAVTLELLNAGTPDAFLHLALAVVFAGVGFLAADVGRRTVT